MRILVVEDDKKVAGFIKKGLEEESYAVDVAYDGEDGLHFGSEGQYDLIILDIMLPKIDGLEILSDVKKELGVPVLTDVHLPDQCLAVSEVVDVLQIPAFLCRQTDLLHAAGKTGKVVNIKKGQFLAPDKMRFAAEKVLNTGNNNILLTERGSSFGYGLVSDMTSIPTMQNTGYPVIFDATHSAQLPGGEQTTGGNRKIIPTIAKAAIAAGCDGLFMEIHDKPEQAKSDAATQWPLDKLESLLASIIKVHEAVKND